MENHMRKILLLNVFISLLGIYTQLLAEVTLDGTVGRSGALPGPDYFIGAELGQQRGGNLFHSFRDFNLNSHESATFSGPNTVQNLISRVTGGNPSSIDGALRSTIPNADVYFLNPYGIMFGPNARLDVQGSFHASTADYLRLGEEGRFDAREPNNSLLTVAPPEAFGFLSNSPASLSIEGGKEIKSDEGESFVEPTLLFVPPEKTLSLYGGNLQISKSFIWAASGRINIASVAGLGEVTPTKTDLELSAPRGNLTVHDSYMDTSSWDEKKPSGDIFIRAGQFELRESYIRANTYGEETGGVIDIRADELTIREGRLTGFASGIGNGGGIKIDVMNSVNITDSYIDVWANNEQENAGNGGTIDLRAERLNLSGNTAIYADTSGPGQGGNIIIRVSDSIRLSGNSFLDLDTWGQTENAGTGGSITLNAKQLHLADEAQISVESRGPGKAGEIKIEMTENVELHNKSSISSSTINMFNKSGEAGSIDIRAKELSLSDESTIKAEARGSNSGGSIHIEIDGEVSLSAHSRIQTGTIVDREAIYRLILQQSLEVMRKIFLENTKGSDETNRVADMVFFALTELFSEKLDQPKELSKIEVSELEKEFGHIFKEKVFNKNSLDSLDKTHLVGEVEQDFSEWFGKKPTVDVQKLVDEVELVFNNFVENHSVDDVIKEMNINDLPNQLGDGGFLALKSGTLTLQEGARISAITEGPGQGGTIDIQVNGLITIKGEGRDASYSGIFARTYGSGKGGDVKLRADELMLKDGAAISASSFGAGPGGQIDIQVNGPVTLVDNDSRGEGSFIGAGAWSSAPNAGPGGHLVLQANELQIIGGAGIETGTIGPGRGGDIDIKVAGRTSLSGKKGGDGRPSRILTASEGQTEKAGEAGILSLETGELYLTDNTTVAVLSTGFGSGGNLTIHANRIHVNERSHISAASSGDGNAGHIVLHIADQLYIENGGNITTATTRADGGNISITSPGYLYLINGDISTSVGAKDGNGGNITLSPAFIVQDSSEIIARAVGGNGGNIDITTTGIYQFPPASKSPIDASSQYGLDGVVLVNSPDVDVSGRLLALPAKFLNAADQLPPPCHARTTENLSRFALVQSEGTANAADDLLPSGPQLSAPWPVKTTKSTNGKGTTAKRAPKEALLAECHPRLSKPALTATKSSTKDNWATEESRIMEEQLF
jgi:filamentous hemagglutinin family protein